MKGMLIKDIMLLKGQVHIFLLITAFGILMLSNGFLTPEIVLTYIMVFTTMLTISTVSYDEFNNGYAYLFTLPITVKTYVLEKYLFGFLLPLGGLLLSVILTEIFARDYELAQHMISYVITWLTMLWLVIIMLPLEFKFGVERSRLITVVLGGVIGVAVWLTAEVTDGNTLKLVKTALNGMDERLSETEFAIVCVGIVLFCYLASMAISVHIMKRKEF